MDLAHDELDGTEELLNIGTRKYAQSKDGRLLDLSTLTDAQYWAYMSRRERSWYLQRGEGKINEDE
jgi:hypothetical protein